MDIDQCFTIGLTHNLSLISSKFINKNSPLNWICNLCGNKFMENIININQNNRGCLKCAYKQFNKKNKK
jgi:formylmethanofuran dehydrogenase subunit E